MSDDSETTIDREGWIIKFEDGYEIGKHERFRDPEERRDHVTDTGHTSDYDYTQPEIEAMQAGFEVGRDEWHPGAEINVYKHANSTFDRSGYATSLSRWGGS